MTLIVLPRNVPQLRRALLIVKELEAYSRSRLAKASDPKAQKARIVARHLPGFTEAMMAYFQGFKERNLPAVRKADDPLDGIDWEAEAATLMDILTAQYEKIGAAAVTETAAHLGIDLKFDLSARSFKPIRDQIATQVSGINDTTRETLRGYVDRTNEAGSGADTLASQLADVLDQWGSDSGRASTIALTETGTAYNLSATSSYRDSGIVEMVDVFDGDDCGWDGHDDDDLANGSVRTLDEADANPLSHPNCQRSFAPHIDLGGGEEG